MRSAVALPCLVLLLASCTGGAHDPIATEPSDAAVPYPDPPADAEVTWDGWVSGFSYSYCVSCHSPSAPCGGSGCHTPSDPGLYALLFDMRQKSSWTERSAIIQCGIAVTQDPAWGCTVPPETYPKSNGGNPMPTDTGRGVVVDWIDAGCP